MIETTFWVLAFVTWRKSIVANMELDIDKRAAMNYTIYGQQWIIKCINFLHARLYVAYIFSFK